MLSQTICRPSRDVSDVHEVLEITVYDDNKDHKYSFLGKVQLRIIKEINLCMQVLLPLLRVTPGEQWHYLKDKSLRKPAKGIGPRILLNITLVFNP